MRIKPLYSEFSSHKETLHMWLDNWKNSDPMIELNSLHSLIQRIRQQALLGWQRRFFRAQWSHVEQDQGDKVHSV